MVGLVVVEMVVLGGRGSEIVVVAVLGMHWEKTDEGERS